MSWQSLAATALLCRGCACTGLAGLTIIAVLFPSWILCFPFRLPLLPQCRKQSQLFVGKLFALAAAFSIEQFAQQRLELAPFAEFAIQLRHQIQHHLLQALGIFRQMLRIDSHVSNECSHLLTQCQEQNDTERFFMLVADIACAAPLASDQSRSAALLTLVP